MCMFYSAVPSELLTSASVFVFCVFVLFFNSYGLVRAHDTIHIMQCKSTGGFTPGVHVCRGERGQRISLHIGDGEDVSSGGH